MDDNMTPNLSSRGSFYSYLDLADENFVKHFYCVRHLLPEQFMSSDCLNISNDKIIL